MYTTRGLGQEVSAADLPLASHSRTLSEILAFIPGFTPVEGQPGVFAVAQPRSDFWTWVDSHTTAIMGGAGVLLLLALVIPGRGRR